MFVVELAGLEAVVQLAEEFVKQVSLGLAVPVSGGAAGVEVTARAGRGAQRSQCPDRAHYGQPPVFDMPMQHHGFLTAGAGDRGRAGESFQPAGIGEAGAVVADLGDPSGSNGSHGAHGSHGCHTDPSAPSAPSDPSATETPI